MAPYMSRIGCCWELIPGSALCRLGGELVSHYTTHKNATCSVDCRILSSLGELNRMNACMPFLSCAKPTTQHFGQLNTDSLISTCMIVMCGKHNFWTTSNIKFKFDTGRLCWAPINPGSWEVWWLRASVWHRTDNMPSCKAICVAHNCT